MTTPTVDDIASAGGLEGGTIVPITRPGDEPGPIARLAKPVPTQWFAEPPPPREHIFVDQDGEGTFPAGIVAFLIGMGGIGKSWLIMMMAISIATGRPFLGWRPDRIGRVLLLFGEEPLAEIHRRLYSAACALRLTPEEQRLVSERVVIAPLAGIPVSLLERGETGNYVESAIARDVSRILRSPGEPWSLVVFDTLARFGSPECEIDNHEATRTVQAFEAFTLAEGHPTVLVTHHSSKAARKESDRGATASRGVSALTDSARWVANLDRMKIGDLDALELTVTKVNYIKYPEPMTIVRDDHGVMRLLTRAKREEATLEAASAKDTKLAERIVDLLSTGAYTNAKDVRAALGARMPDVQRVMGSLRGSRRIEQPKRGEPYQVITPCEEASE